MTNTREDVILLLSKLVNKIDGKIQKIYEIHKGLECRIIVEGVPMGGILFRAFIPDSGYPVELDLFTEGDRMCNSENELTEEVMKYLSFPDIQLLISGILPTEGILL